MAKRHPTPKLPKAQQDEWNKRYDTALKAAQISIEDEQARHTAALKEANKMLAVPAPESAADIDKLADWQVTKREDREIGGVPHRVCVTIDGHKYAHAKIKATPNPK